MRKPKPPLLVMPVLSPLIESSELIVEDPVLVLVVVRFAMLVEEALAENRSEGPGSPSPKGCA